MIKNTHKFSDSYTTAKGEKRAWIKPIGLKTLWFNTGTLCNLACENCYIESTPRNDRLVYLSLAEVEQYLDEIARENFPVEEIGITGGEPFMNPDIIPILESCLNRGFRVLCLTNAMRPMMKLQDDLLRLKNVYGDRLVLRISVDHFDKEKHEQERGPRSWDPMMKGLVFLSENGFKIDIAGRTQWGESEDVLRCGFQNLFNKNNIPVDAYNKKELILFPEMDEAAEVPEITTACWDILGVNPDDIMCATSRMIVKHKGDASPSVQACTLLAYEQEFNLGATLKDADCDVYLNHPHCSKFCVLGGGSCTADG